MLKAFCGIVDHVAHEEDYNFPWNFLTFRRRKLARKIGWKCVVFYFYKHERKFLIDVRESHLKRRKSPDAPRKTSTETPLKSPDIRRRRIICLHNQSRAVMKSLNNYANLRATKFLAES